MRLPWGTTRVTFEEVNGYLTAKDYFDVDPYGVPLQAINQSSNSAVNNNFKMQGKEELGFGLNGLRDFGARFSDATIGGIWNAVDPLADHPNQVGISPYAYANNDPINKIDSDGRLARDIIPILARNGATGVAGHNVGHTGVLIGSDKNGWRFISKEGRDKSDNAPWYSNELTGGPALPPRDLKFKTKADFDAYKAEKMSEYTEEVRFKTTEEQDKKATTAALESAKSWYNAFCNNCADTVSDAMQAAGLDGGTSRSTATNAPNTQSAIPNIRYDNMKKNNASLIVPEPPKPPAPPPPTDPNQPR